MFFISLIFADISFVDWGAHVPFPTKANVQQLIRDNDVFFDLFHVATGLKSCSFWKVAGFLAISQCGKIPKPICHMHMINLTTGNPYTPLMIPRLLDILKMSRQPPILPILGDVKQASSISTVPFVQFFAQSAPEFEDRRSPPEHSFVLESTEPPLNTAVPHHTVSYIRHLSPLQADVVSSFLFNSEYISVQTGSEGGDGNDDDDMAFGAEIYQFFQVTSVVPDLQVKMANFKRTYAMLVTRPFSAYNRFPEYLLFTIHMVFEKSSKKILDAMNTNYEMMAPVIAKTVKNVIDKINGEMPRYLMFLTSRYSFHAARSYYGFQNVKLDQAKKRLNENKGPITLEIAPDTLWVYRFMKSYCNVVHHDLKPARLFFQVMENLQGELLMHKQFVGALILISTMTDGFREFDERFTQETRDILTLEARDKFILKVAERSVIDGTTPNDFIHSDAPLSMRLFFEYAVALSTTQKDISPQKLTFATYSGCKLMSQINTFCGILSSLQITGEFFALCDTYYEHLHSQMNYVGEVSQILQGRRICGISKPDANKIVIRNIPCETPYMISSHYMYLPEEPASTQESEEEL